MGRGGGEGGVGRQIVLSSMLIEFLPARQTVVWVGNS